MTNCTNPIRGAALLARAQAAGADEHGRIAPQLLAGEGADKFIADNDLKTSDLISTKSIKVWGSLLFKAEKENSINSEVSRILTDELKLSCCNFSKISHF